MKSALLGFLAVLPLVAAHADQPVVTDAGSLAIGDFFKTAAFRDAVLSPDGKYVAAINRADPQHEYITLIDLTKETSADVVATSDDREYFNYLEWISDDTLTFYDYHTGDDTKLVAAKMSIDKDGKPKADVNLWSGSFWILDRLIGAGNDVLLARREQDCVCIYRVDINESEDKFSKKQEVHEVNVHESSLVTDKDGNLDILGTTDDDGTRHFFRNTPGPKGDSWKEFKKLTDRKLVFSPQLMAPDGHDLYVFSNIGHDTIGYFEYDPDTDKFVRTLYANDDEDVAGENYDPVTDSFIYVKWYEGTDPHYEILDPRAKVFAPALRDAFPGQQVVPTYISADGKQVLVFVYSDVNPGSFYAFDVARRNAQLLGAEYPWLDPRIMAPVKQGSLKTSDGFTVTYLVSTPRTGHGPYPLVVVPHGGPIGVFNVNSFDPETQLLVSRGYAVLEINYRGSGAGGKAFLDAGKHQWGRKIEDDIEQAVHAVMRSEPVDPDRVCIYGASYGGYSALMSVIRDPGLYKCAASYAGVTDLPLLYDTTDVEFDKQVKDDMADIIGDPTTDSAQLRAVSPVYLADKIRRPVFLAQGGKDTRVDMEQAYRMKLVMETLKRPLEFRFYPDEIHGFNSADDETDFYLHLLDFFGRNIASNRPVMPAPGP